MYVHIKKYYQIYSIPFNKGQTVEEHQISLFDIYKRSHIPKYRIQNAFSHQ